MLTHFFAHAAQRVLKPIADRTGQTKSVDESLGAAGLVDRFNELPGALEKLGLTP